MKVDRCSVISVGRKIVLGRSGNTFCFPWLFNLVDASESNNGLSRRNTKFACGVICASIEREGDVRIVKRLETTFHITIPITITPINLHVFITISTHRKLLRAFFSHPLFL